MAKNLATILKTDVMSGVPLRALAEAVRRSGRGRDTVLAHITPREAAKLKREGGRGSINPETGLPEFEDGVDFGGMDFNFTAAEPYVGDVSGIYGSEGGFDAAQFYDQYQPLPNYEFSDAAMADLPAAGAYPAAAEGAGGFPVEGPVPPPAPSQEERDALAKLQQGDQSALQKLMTGRNVLGLLGAGAGLYGTLQARQQAAQLASQFAKTAEQQRQMAQPYMTQGGQLLGTALQGGLSPVQQQAFDAARARIAQQAERSGGVGAAQAAGRTEDLRQRMIQNQIDAAIKLLGPGNTLINSALATELRGYMARTNLQNQAATAAGNFFTALAKLYAG